MKIYITRHGKTVWNQEKRLQGRKDSPLIQEGIDNAYALKEYIKDIHFDYIYSSPIQRAYNTATIIFDSKRIIKDDRLLEMNFGDFEGKKISELLNRDDHLYYNMWHHPELFTRINNGESYNDVIFRCHSFIDTLKSLDNDTNVMVVTHGMYFIVLICTMLNLEVKDFVLYNQKVVDGCSVTIVDYTDDKFKIEVYNKNDFLPHIFNESFSK